MPFTNFPYGSTSFGIPSLGGGIPISVPSGQRTSAIPAGTVWWVDANNTGGPHTGASPGEAFQTIMAALAVAQSGDTIYVFPGSYNENVVVSTDYITIIGAQYAGYAKPDIGNSTGVALTVNAQGFRAIHCRFFSNDNSDVVRQQGNGFYYSDCFFDGNGTQTTSGCVRLIPSNVLTGQTASEGIIEGCYFRGSTSTIGAIIFDTSNLNGGSTDDIIRNNVFTQNTGPDIAAQKSGAAGTYSLQFAVIHQNIFEDKNKAVYIDFLTNADGAAANQKGVISGNWFNSATLTNVLVKINGTGFGAPGNYYQVGIKDTSAF